RLTTVAVDIVGHGQSDKPLGTEHYRMPRVVADIVTAVRMAGFERCAWLGYSMGGRTALQVATAFPGTVERLMLIGASAGIADAEGRAARVADDERLAQRILDEGVPAFVDYWESIPLFASQRSLPEETRAAIRAGRLGCDRTGLANSLRGMGTGAQEPLYGRLSELAMPVLAMAGELDTRYTELAHELAAAIPCGRSAVAPNAGHAAHIENPEWCAEQATAFVLNAEGDHE
ncbi:MAG: alpha/beta fold hydrolase, partial [Dehalococcoidia bacterium]|nr:alpha/beta fold hydrolase [Dehalococcoidia bacterium]